MQNNLGSDPEFGPMSSELRAAWRLRIVVFVLILACCGLVAAASASSGETLVALIAVLVGLALCALLQFLLSGIRLRVFQHGIEYQSRFGTKRIAWNNLKTYQLYIVDSTAMAGAAGGLVGALIARGIQRAFKQQLAPSAVILTSKDGTKLSFGKNLARYPELITTLVPFLTEQLFAVAKTSYESGAELTFGKKVTLQREVGITVAGLFGKKQTLPLNQIASASLERATLVIRRSDTNAVWQNVAANLVLDVGVLLKFIELYRRPYDEGLPLAWTSQ